MRSGLTLPQEDEDRLRQFRLMLKIAEAEADRDGTVSLDSVLAEINEVIGTNEK